MYRGLICDSRCDLSCTMFCVHLRRKCNLLFLDGMSYKYQIYLVYCVINFIYFYFILFIYFWLHWVFVACELSLVVARGATLRCGAWASHFGGFSCCRAWALGVWASVVVARRLSSCGSQALEHRLSICGTRA